MDKKFKISMGSDHGGYHLKEIIKDYLKDQGHTIIDEGPSSDESVDYPEFGHKIGRSVASGQADFGIGICGSGIGISIACNKVEGIRAALVSETTSARLSREHNNANVVCMGARLIGPDMAKDIVDTFLSTDFDGGRHQRRIDKIEC